MNSLKKLTGALGKQKLNAFKLLQKNKAAGGQAQEGIPALTESQPERKTHFVMGGPHLYISQLLNRKGHLTSKQIWYEYTRDREARKNKILPSKTYLKQKILATMTEQGKIERTPYSKIKKKYLGFKLNPQKAFKNVHPEIVSSLVPEVNVKTRKIKSVSEDGTPLHLVPAPTSPRLRRLANMPPEEQTEQKK